MRVIVVAGLVAFTVTVFWLSTLYRRAPNRPVDFYGSGWRDLENVDSA